MRELTANTIGKKLDRNPSDQKLFEKKQRDLLRRERLRKFREQLGVFEHGRCAASRRTGRATHG